MINLKIDPEFQNQIPPLTDDEYKQLEENILKEGKLLSPLIIWNNILVDGHNRYEIVQEHPEISFSTMPLPFESREEVLAWICKNQLGRRNLTPEQKYYLMGKQYEAEKAAHGGDRKSSDAKSSSLNCLWLLAGCVRVGAPCFCFVLNLLAHGSQPHSSNIPPDCHSESNRHSPVGHCR